MHRLDSVVLSRRQFTRVLSTSALFAALPSDRQPLQAQETQNQQAPSETPPIRDGWIDAHVHVWHPDTNRYPIGPNFKVTDMQPASFTADELFAHCRPQDVQRVVLIQMSFYEQDHSYMVDVMQSHPGRFSGVSLIDWHHPELEREVKRHAAMGMRGFRLHSHGDAKDWVDDADMSRLWRLATEHGIAICPLVNPQDIAFVDALCERHGDTTVVVDHFARIGLSGTIEQNRLQELCRLARFPNVNVKTSAFYALGRKQKPYTDLVPMIRQVVDAFGPKRLMWASDCPFQVQGDHTYEASIALIRDHIDFLSASDKQAMLRDTADRVFFAAT